MTNSSLHVHSSRSLNRTGERWNFVHRFAPRSHRFSARPAWPHRQWRRYSSSLRSSLHAAHPSPRPATRRDIWIVSFAARCHVKDRAWARRLATACSFRYSRSVATPRSSSVQVSMARGWTGRPEFPTTSGKDDVVEATRGAPHVMASIGMPNHSQSEGYTMTRVPAYRSRSCTFEA
jgi:hypothetical protein